MTTAARLIACLLLCSVAAEGGTAIALVCDVPGKPRRSSTSQGIILGKNTTTGESFILTSGHYVEGGMNFRIPGNPPVPVRVIRYEHSDSVDLGLLATRGDFGPGTAISSGEFHGEACVQTVAVFGRWERQQTYVSGNRMGMNIWPGYSGAPVTDIDGRLIGIATHFPYDGSKPAPKCGPGVMMTADQIREWLTRIGYPPKEENTDWYRINDKPTIELQPGDAVAIENPQEPYTWVYVFTMPNCPPCDRFKADVAAYPEFFKGFRFKFFDVMEPGANVHGLKTVPQFRQIGGEFIRGYKGKEWLLSQLVKPEPVEQAPAVPPVSTIPDDATPIADSAPVAPPIEQPKLPEQPPPAPAARVEPSTEVQPTTAGVWGWGLSLAQIGIAFATGGVGAGAVTAAGKLWGLRSRRKRSQNEPASAGDTRAPPGCIPELLMFDIPDTQHREAYKAAVSHACNDLRQDKAALRGVTYLHGVYKQAIAAEHAAQGE